MSAVQLQLLGSAPTRKLSNKERFEHFHRENPQVYARLRDMALRLRRAGRERYSVKTLVEILRWETAIDVKKDSEWKFNNSYSRFYARLLMDREQELVDFFETRERRIGR